MQEHFPSSQEIQEAWSDPDIQIVRTIQIAFAAGVLLFVGVVVFLVVTSPQPVSDQTSLLNVLTGLNIILFLAVFGLSSTISRVVLQMARGKIQSVYGWNGTIRTGWILHLVVREMAALFGVVTTLVAVMTGVLPEHTTFWVNLVPAALFVAQCLTDLPDAVRLTRFYTENVFADQGSR